MKAPAPADKKPVEPITEKKKGTKPNNKRNTVRTARPGKRTFDRKDGTGRAYVSCSLIIF